MEEKLILFLTRKVVENFVKEGKVMYPPNYPKELNANRGVFVTLYKKTGGKKTLRGCIGMPYPERPLIESLVQSAVFATQDSRFEPLKESELKQISIEVSILTEPKLIDVETPSEYLSEIKVGEDGLIIKHGHAGGLLLPQVPTEYGWTVKEYLENLCLKAGMMPDDWKNEGVDIYKFSAQILSE